MSEEKINGGLSQCEAFTKPQPHSAMTVHRSPKMRAKMRVASVQKHEGFTQETLKFSAVCKSDGYPADGSDEDNTFARWTPSGELTLAITNPALHGKFTVGDKFYLDFTPTK